MSVFAALKPIYGLLPEVKAPEQKPSLKNRLLWSGIVLLVFFMLGNISLIGVSPTAAQGQIQQLQTVLASHIGTPLTAGIGPLVLASIILQLLIGGGIVKLDLSDPAEKAEFSGAQKIVSILLSFVEASVYATGGLLAPQPGMFALVVLQVALGSIILLYLDEVVSKYGIGSGIGLFIAAGVAVEIVWRVFAPVDTTGVVSLSDASGLLFVFFREFANSNVWGAVVVAILPILFTLIVFLSATYAEGIHVNIPLTMGRRGTGGRYPVKFLYVSNMPVILAVAMFQFVAIMGTLLSKVPFVGKVANGLAAIVIAPHGLIENVLLQGFTPEMLNQIVQSVTSLHFIGIGGDILHALLYITILVVVCVVFGSLWIEVGGQGPDRIADQLDRAGMYIPGFRRDPRVIRQVLDRYIPTITILGSAFVGVLAGFADLTGAIGTGTGVLLTVGIVYRLYEELAKEQIIESHPILGKLMG